ncbi:hypothetical protein KH5_23840 [Urechidicola sp. KH5]
MKKIYLIALFFTVFNQSYSQDKYDIFIEKMGVENDVKAFVNNYIDQLASQSTNISTAQWEEYKSKIDYSPYLIGIKAILKDIYTITEIDDLLTKNDVISPINDTGEFIFKPKPEVTERMYKISRTFGKLVNVQLKKMIEAQ